MRIVPGGVRIEPVSVASGEGVVLLGRFRRVEPLLFDCGFEDAAVYRLARADAVLGLAAVRPSLTLQEALDVPSCRGHRVDLLEAIALLPQHRRRGFGRKFLHLLLDFHPRLVCVASEDSRLFWESLAPAMVPHPLREGCFVSEEVAFHLRACRPCAGEGHSG